jgi:hypothetical protein
MCSISSALAQSCPSFTDILMRPATPAGSMVFDFGLMDDTLLRIVSSCVPSHEVVFNFLTELGQELDYRFKLILLQKKVRLWKLKTLHLIIDSRLSAAFTGTLFSSVGYGVLALGTDTYPCSSPSPRNPL